MIRIAENTFEPAIFSNEELAFLHIHLQETPAVALHKGTPPGVNPVAVRGLLEQLQTFDQLRKVHGVQWAGFDAVADSIERYLAWMERSEEIHRRTGGNKSNSSIRHPSLFLWDGNGNAYKHGIDADSAEMVRTEILPTGERRAFAVRLMETESTLMPSLQEVAPWFRLDSVVQAAQKDDVVIDRAKRNGTMTCSICGKAEAFDTTNRQSFSAARARMSKHMMQAKTDIARHRTLHRKFFESPTRKA